MSLPVQGAATYYEAFPVPVRAADDQLPSVLQVSLLDGRWLNAADSRLHLYRSCSAAGSPSSTATCPARSGPSGSTAPTSAWSASSAPCRSTPPWTTPPSSPSGRPRHVFGTNGQPNELYVRTKNGTTQATANALPTAINLGGPDQLSTQVPSDVLAAQAQANKTLQKVALFAGLLVLTVGGFGIANVMSISVIQRSAEIGIRRAVGHSRSTIGAQFLLESLFVGVLGGALGALIGIGVVYLVAAVEHWVVEIGYGQIPLWIGLALLVSVIAGLYPSVKAARLEPLETLRLG